MTDKEVGELWHQVTLDCGKMDGCANHGDLIAVIRKLVEERKRRYLENPVHAQRCNHEAELHHALRDFGIEVKEWKEKP